MQNAKPGTGEAGKCPCGARDEKSKCKTLKSDMQSTHAV
jgi:hypothetical protein